MSKKIDLTGQRFGRLRVCEDSGYRNGRTYWKCTCDCGNTCIVSGHELKNGHTKSCGCLGRETSQARAKRLFTKHGLFMHPLYFVWGNMKARCGVIKGAKPSDVRNYADRGITICEEWLVFENFYNWAISHGWEKGVQIDRIDNNKGYSANNCHFVSPKTNCRNRRTTILYTNGKALIDVCDEIDKPYHKALREFHKYGVICVEMPF